MNRKQFVNNELTEEMDRLRALKGQLDYLISVALSMPQGEDRDRIMGKAGEICDALEEEALNLRAWHQTLREVPDVH